MKIITDARDGLKDRNSNIELLKIIAMCLIVTCHVVAELPNSGYVDFDDYVYEYYLPSSNLENLVLTIIHQLGYLGNTIFFTCSAWFLCQSERVNYRKIISLSLEIEVVSVLFLILGMVVNKGNIDIVLGIKMLFPHTFRLFWYLTCYIIIYLIHPTLNNIISSLSKRRHLIFVVLSSVTFIGLNYLVQWYFGNVLISWIVLYFIVAYIRRYMLAFQQNWKANFVVFLLGVAGIIAVPLAINFAGINISKLGTMSLQRFDDISRWNPFHIMVSISAYNMIYRLKTTHNGLINYFASLSLLCFVMHSNRIMRCYFIPFVWQKLYEHGFYRQLIMTSLLFGILYFLASMMISIVYDNTLRKFFDKYLVSAMYEWGKRVFNSVISALMKVLK